MAFNFSQSMASIFGSKKPTTTLPTPIKPVDYSGIMKPNTKVPNILNSMSAPSVPSFATPAPTTSPTAFGPQAIPQVKATTPAPKQSTPAQNVPVAPLSNAGNFTTPSGAVVDAKGNLITPPPDQSGTSQNASGEANKPPVPVVTPEAQKALDSANKAYAESLKISPEELSTQEDLDKLVDSTKKGYLATSGQAIPMEFITGQLKSIEERATNLAEPLERKLARLQAQRTSSLESNKFALERAQKKVDAEKDASKPIAGTSFYDPVTKTFIQAPSTSKASEGFTLSPGEKRYDAAGNLIASGGEKPLSDAQVVKNQEKEDAKKAGTSAALDNYSLVNELLKNPALSQISGLQNVFTVFTPGTQAQTAKNIYSQIKSILALENRQKLKGSGAISDFEAQTLEKAASALGRNLSDAEFQKQLKKIRGAFATSAGMEADVEVTNPNTGETISSTASRAEIDQLIAEGNTVEYI